MIELERQLAELKKWNTRDDGNILSVYADVNPAKPENANGAWRTYVKNALKELPEIKNVAGKRDTSLYNKVLNLIHEERPEARTMALFARRKGKKKLEAIRIDLQVDLPIVDLQKGKVDTRYGDIYVDPLVFAADEYERTGILLLDADEWRFFEVFLGYIREEQKVFPTLMAEDWKKIKTIQKRVSKIYETRSGDSRRGGILDKLSLKDRHSAHLDAWIHKMYKQLGHMLEKAINELNIDRIVFVGEQWQIENFKAIIPRRLSNKIVATHQLPKHSKNISPDELWHEVMSTVEGYERKKESELLTRIEEERGVKGVKQTLEALQIGRVHTWVLPWSLDLTVFECAKEKVVAADAKQAKKFCADATEVPLRDRVVALANMHGAHIDFVKDANEKKLIKDMGGMAGLLRW